MNVFPELTEEVLKRVAAVSAPVTLDRVEAVDYGDRCGLLFAHNGKRVAYKLSRSIPVLNRKWWQFWRRKWRAQRRTGDEIEIEAYRCAIEARKTLHGTTEFEAIVGGEEALKA